MEREMESAEEPVVVGESRAAEPPKRGGSKKGRKVRQPTRLLRDLRHVYEKGGETDATPGQRTLRKMFEDRPGEFVAMLQRAEASHRAGKDKDAKPAAQQGVIGKDEGTERCVAILDEWIESWHGKGGVKA